MIAKWFLLAAAVVEAALLPERQAVVDSPTRYSQCGADRGYTEADSLLAAQYLTETIILSDHHPLPSRRCVHSHVNSTIISLCNDSTRNRTVNRAEVRRGIDQLIKDCGLQGGFTGTHVVNNLTFRAWGSAGLAFGAPLPRPAKSTAIRSPAFADSTHHRLSKRDCRLTYNGEQHFDCNKVNKINPETGLCVAELRPDNHCQAFCEIRRTGMWGPERRLEGPEGQAYPSGQFTEITTSKQVEVSNSFQIGIEGIYEEVIGLGVSYQWSMAVAKGVQVTRKTEEKNTDLKSRWVVLPQLIESCGQVARQSMVGGGSCNGDGCTPDFPSCTGDVEYFDNICSIAPLRNPDGSPQLTYLMRYEYPDGTVVEREKQSASYLGVCGAADIDRDPELECYNYMD